MGEGDAVCLLAESNAWDSQREDFRFTPREMCLELTFQLGGKTTATRSKSRNEMFRVGPAGGVVGCHFDIFLMLKAEVRDFCILDTQLCVLHPFYTQHQPTSSHCRRKFCIAKVQTGCSLVADTRGLLEGEWVASHWQSGEG